MRGSERAVCEPFNNPYENGSGLYKCQLCFERNYFNGYGNNNAEARENCAEIFYDWLNENGYIRDPIEGAIGDPSEDESIRQLNELYQKGLISKPIYTFKQGYDDYGNIEWRCECLVEENGRSFYNFASTKKEAQRLSAFESILDLMGIYDDNE